LYVASQFPGSRTISTSIAVTGTWGILSPPGSYFSYPMAPTTVWEQNQILFSLLFILPLLVFAFFFGEKSLDRNCIIAASISILLSFITVYLLTPDYNLIAGYPSPNLVVPGVISLAIFVFVFWPLLKNSWPSPRIIEEVRQKKGIRSKIRRALMRVVPFNMATLVWVSMSVFPAVLTISNMIFAESQVSYNLWISGGLPTVSYQYLWFISSGQLYPLMDSTFLFNMAAWTSLIGLLIWSLNLILGILTLRFVMGKSSMRRVRTLATILILFYLIPSVVITGASLLSGLGLYTIPLPFYPLAMLLVAKYASPPDQGQSTGEEMIRIPLTTRIASFFRRHKPSQETSNESETDSDVEDTSNA